MSLYKCETCGKTVAQVYGDNVEGKYIYRCVTCAFKKK